MVACLLQLCAHQVPLDCRNWVCLCLLGSLMALHTHCTLNNLHKRSPTWAQHMLGTRGRRPPVNRTRPDLFSIRKTSYHDNKPSKPLWSHGTMCYLAVESFWQACHTFLTCSPPPFLLPKCRIYLGEVRMLFSLSPWHRASSWVY